MLLISTSVMFVKQERPTHTRTWNLKAALGLKRCKVNQQYQHTNLNQINMCSPKGLLLMIFFAPPHCEIDCPIMSNVSRHPDTKNDKDALGAEVP